MSAVVRENRDTLWRLLYCQSSRTFATMTHKSTDERGALQRLLGRLRHGLIIQEILDRLMRQ